MSSPSANDLEIFSRDPAGFFWINEEGRALRYVFEPYKNDALNLLQQNKFQEWMQSKAVISTKLASFDEQKSILPAAFLTKNLDSGLILEHEKIKFPSYPYEWSPLMLYEAGLLTLDLAERSLEFGYSLKDASAYNILFNGNAPCFIDFLSFEKRNPLDGTWTPYAQFLRHFILPLLCVKYFGSSLKEIFLVTRDGIDTERILKQLSFFQRLRPPFLNLITLPKILGKLGNISYHKKLFSSRDQADFVLRTLFKHLRKSLKKFKPEQKTTTWTQYSHCSHCTEEYATIKRKWILDFLQEHPVHNVLDVGCNLGEYSKLFSTKASQVVSLDIDPTVIDLFWKENRKNYPNILTLNLDLTWPSPALGWEYRQSKNFLERSTGHFDTVLMYAVLHHLMITGEISLPLIANLANQLSTQWLILEYIGPEDDLFKKLLRGRESIYKNYHQDYFEKCFNPYFEIVRLQKIPNMDRILYLFSKKK